MSPRRIACFAGLSTRPSPHTVEVSTAGALIREEIQPARRVRFYAQEFAPRVGLRPVEVGPHREGVRFDRGRALKTQHERPHEQQERHEARHRVPGQADESRFAALIPRPVAPHRAERERPARLHRDPPQVEAPFGIDRGLDVILLADRHAARRDDDVAGRGCRAQCCARRFERVGHDAEILDVAAEHAEEAVST